MRNNITTHSDRAINLLHDYFCLLQDGKDPAKFKLYGEAIKPRKFRRPTDSQSVGAKEMGKVEKSHHNRWRRGKEAQWEKEGRINSLGFLRVSNEPQEWTLTRVCAAAPGVGMNGQIELLLDLEGRITPKEWAGLERRGCNKEAIRAIVNKRLEDLRP